MSIGLGLDTGGTYTDAVILDLKTGVVLNKAKALTVKENLVLGIENAIAGFDDEILKQVSIVSLSSTLATNSVVEGKGCRVGLICIGRGFDDSIKIDEYVKISGRHDICGNEIEPLSTETAAEFIKRVKGKVDCIAITGYMSIRNPEHEIAVREIVAREADIPVVCGYQLSSMLGFNERAVTAVMNAKLIPVIKDLVQSVEKVMLNRNIHAPTMIVKGDGSIMNVKVAEDRPVETILCGPAASLNGAKTLTGLNNAVVVDVGGTTTDIGILRDGFPSINPEGATIGGRRTHVMAADISVSGIGGDSRILLNGTKISLTPLRVVPLCIAASKWPELIDDLKEALQSPLKRRESVDERNVISDTEFFTTSKPANTEPLSPLDRELLALIEHRPLSLRRAGAILSVDPKMFNIERMEEFGLIQRIGLTPTDILHSEGSYVEYVREASELGVLYTSIIVGIPKNDLIAKIKEMVYEKIVKEILKKIIYDEIGCFEISAVSENLLSKVATCTPGRDYSCSICLNKSIIGIGAPVNAWLPEVSRRLNTQFVSSENSGIGNAIGAISGCIVESINILIEPKGMCLDYNGPCCAHSKLGKVNFDTINKCIEYAKAEGTKFTEQAAIAAGASSVTVCCDIKQRTFEVEGSKAILDITVSVTATGKPSQMI